jgi:3-oxoacyl-[acyl-carrier protein] reductase
VAITYRKNQEGADSTAQEIQSIGRRVEVIRADISRGEEVEALVGRLKATFGIVDVWINNAGADILTGEAGRMPRLKKLDLVLSVDLRGTIIASWAAVDLMRAQGGGVIINMAWDHVSVGMKGENPGLYSAAKGGIASFVNILAPGFIETTFGQGADPKFRQQVVQMTPLGRWGTPDDVAAAAVFLASDDAAFLTGQTIAVNGGVVM